MSSLVLPPQREPRPGERCVCGRLARTVFLLKSGAESPTCRSIRLDPLGPRDGGGR